MLLLHDLPRERTPISDRLLFGMQGLYADLGLTDYIVSPEGRMWAKEHTRGEYRWTYLSDYHSGERDDIYFPYWSRVGRTRLAEAKRVDESLISVSDIDTSLFKVFFASPPLHSVSYEDYPF